ncbi:DUF456 domain-containing protein [Aquimarina algicola]|uniref:DUF456 domain-containing protein n=1 Tax=Aquimarina algicola TaxID=2589995 RepID=A0A504J9N6_9FLAO|nr:DUF456 domain-containing protein [Aquimarina algicola]TPN87344.1 DUF456 domain-containing protein [Aquimarina algicola]
MDIILVIIGFVFCLFGIIGSFLPILPGPITSWIGLLLLHFTDAITRDWVFLGITLAISIIVWVLDYVVPALGTKKFGGTKYGMIGSSLGLIVGLLYLGPFGIIIGPFVGAYAGEFIKDSSNSSKAFKAALGSFIGFLAGTFIKFIVSLVFLVLFVRSIWEQWDAFF